jgi:hypothetical protein
MTRETVLAFRPREHYPDSVKQERPSPGTPGCLMVFPTWDPALDAMLAWAAREDPETFLRWRRPTEATQEPAGEPAEADSLTKCGADNQT